MRVNQRTRRRRRPEGDSKGPTPVRDHVDVCRAKMPPKIAFSAHAAYFHYDTFRTAVGRLGSTSSLAASHTRTQPPRVGHESDTQRHDVMFGRPRS